MRPQHTETSQILIHQSAGTKRVIVNEIFSSSLLFIIVMMSYLILQSIILFAPDCDNYLSLQTVLCCDAAVIKERRYVVSGVT